MRRRWPVLVTAIPLIVGWAAVTAYPAAAAAGVARSGFPGTGWSETGGWGAGYSETGGWGRPGGPVSQVGHTSAGGGLKTSLGAALTEQNVVTSSNWAGYADTGVSGQFTSVASSWVQPTGHCSSGNRYAAFWVGLDGYSSSTVEQTGSEVDCVGRTPRYYAWYEIYPSAEVNFASRVKPGDHLTGSVVYQGSNRFLLTLKDTTRGWTRTVTKTLARAARSSAEVIAEAPCCTSGGGILPLTSFGKVSFSAASMNDAGLCTLSPVEVTMPDTKVSSLSSCGAFRVSYTGGSSGLPFSLGSGSGSGGS